MKVLLQKEDGGPSPIRKETLTNVLEFFSSYHRIDEYFDRFKVSRTDTEYLDEYKVHRIDTEYLNGCKVYRTDTESEFFFFSSFFSDH